MILVKISDFVGQYALALSNGTNPVLQSYIDREEKQTLYKLLGKELADLLITYIALTKTTQTSGTITVGQTYTITTYNAGDDFTNVGAASNASGVSFVATGTTPTVWTNGSTVTNKVDRYENILNPFYIDNDMWYGYTDGQLWCEAHNSTGIKDLLLNQIYYSYIVGEQIFTSGSGIATASIENGSIKTSRIAYQKAEQKWNEQGVSTWWAIRWYCFVKYSATYPEYRGRNPEIRYGSRL